MPRCEHKWEESLCTAQWRPHPWGSGWKHAPCLKQSGTGNSQPVNKTDVHFDRHAALKMHILIYSIDNGNTYHLWKWSSKYLMIVQQTYYSNVNCFLIPPHPLTLYRYLYIPILTHTVWFLSAQSTPDARKMHGEYKVWTCQPCINLQHVLFQLNLYKVEH